MTADLHSSQNYAELRWLLSGVDAPFVLNVGGGEGGVGQEQIGHVRMLTTDVVIGEYTSAVADAHDLPFADETFDAVIVQAVLEHVLRPQRCVEEIHRVLKPGGYIYSETPFMQQVHLGRYDFTRFTDLGHRRLFNRFDEISTGMTAGPGSALAWSLTYFVTSFATSRRQRRFFHAGARCLFFWIKYFDYLVSRNDAAFDAASGFYLLGRRSQDTLSDKDLIAKYQGAIET